MNWYEFITVVSATLIPSITTSVIAIIKAVKADNKANNNSNSINDVANDVTKIADNTVGISKQELASTKIVNGHNK